MYELHDTFNQKMISRHRTLQKAVETGAKFQRDVKRNNPPGAYIPTKILRDGQILSEQELEWAAKFESEL